MVGTFFLYSILYRHPGPPFRGSVFGPLEIYQQNPEPRCDWMSMDPQACTFFWIHKTP